MFRSAFGTPQMFLTSDITLLAMTTHDEQRQARPPAMGNGEKSADSGLRTWQRSLAKGSIVLGAAPTGLLIGYFVDRAAGTSPWSMLALGFLCLAGAIFRLIKESGK